MIQSLFLLSLLLCPLEYNLSNPIKGLDKLYLDWKKVTIQALEKRANNTTDSLKRNTFLNRINAVNVVTQKEESMKIDTLAIRYLLLKDHFTNIISSKGDVFIIEIKTMTSAISFTDLIIHRNDNHIAIVDAFRFNGKKWIAIQHFSCDEYFLQENLSTYYLENEKGINFNETIITKFSKGKLKMSEYFITKSLSSKCGLQNIFDKVDQYYYK
ncbi:hypothetical protein BW716_33095 [[Flexibacter] sp. ATCC 35208]|nr:hypothetical protein BW716_33095 [[Flexibacter] sp. ATCC 35208]